MMDTATLVLTAVIVSIVLQIVLIIIVLDMKKKSGKTELKPSSNDTRDTRKPREHDNRFANAKRPHEQRPKPVQAQPQSADPVERSLRDINLRLKNAERDQEKERKRIKDTITPESQKRPDGNRPPRDKDDNYRRNDRPRHNQQRRPSDNQRSNGDNRNSQGQQQREFRSAPPAAAEAPVVAPIVQEQILPQTIVAPQQPVAAVAPVIEKIQQQTVETAPEAAMVTETLQHGRKVMVKRRVLNVEEEAAAQASAEGTPVQAQAPEAQAPEMTPDETSTGPIHFGR